MKRNLILLSLIALGGCWDRGTGEKIGTVIRLNHEGVICQTYEGELIRGGMAGGSGSFGTIFHFTVEGRPDLIAKLHEYMEKQTEVRITYRMELVTLCRSENRDNVFLTDVVPLTSAR